MLDHLIAAAPVLALLISVAALWIGFYNLRTQLRACILASWASPKGTQRYLVLTNTGPGIAKIINVQLHNELDKPPIDFKYAADRDIFPFELGSGASFEVQLDKENQSHPSNVRVEWKDVRWRMQSQRIPVSSMRSNG